MPSWFPAAKHCMQNSIWVRKPTGETLRQGNSPDSGMHVRSSRGVGRASYCPLAWMAMDGVMGKKIPGTKETRGSSDSLSFISTCMTNSSIKFLRFLFFWSLGEKERFSSVESPMGNPKCSLSQPWTLFFHRQVHVVFPRWICTCFIQQQPNHECCLLGLALTGS